MDRTPFDYLALGLKIRFGHSVEILPEIPLPREAYDASRDQWEALTILRMVVPRRLAWRTLAVAGVDLYNNGPVFGESDPVGHRAIFSVERLRPERAGEPSDRELLLGRCLKEAVHEVGHTVGLPHCRDRFCVMRLSNTLADTDLKRDAFCERCRRVAAWRIASVAGTDAPRASR